MTLIGASILLWSASGAVADPPQLQIKNPFELATVFQLAALIALILLVAKALAGLAGTTGLFLLAAASGIADVDALTLSMTRLAGVQVVVGDAGTAILIAASVNTASKAGLAAFVGGRRLGSVVGIVSMVAIASLIAVFAVQGQ